MIRIAFECFADRDLVRFLHEGRGLSLGEVHASSQGRVLNALEKEGRADVGIVDEDPLSSHHRLRDGMQVVHETENVQLRRSAGGARHLIVIKPDLEKCFFASMKRVGLTWAVVGNPSELHRQLASSTARRHHDFRDQLRTLHDRALERKLPVLTTDIEDVLRTLGA